MTQRVPKKSGEIQVWRVFYPGDIGWDLGDPRFLSPFKSSDLQDQVSWGGNLIRKVGVTMCLGTEPGRPRKIGSPVGRGHERLASEELRADSWGADSQNGSAAARLHWCTDFKPSDQSAFKIAPGPYLNLNLTIRSSAYGKSSHRTLLWPQPEWSRQHSPTHPTLYCREWKPRIFELQPAIWQAIQKEKGLDILHPQIFCLVPLYWFSLVYFSLLLTNSIILFHTSCHSYSPIIITSCNSSAFSLFTFEIANTLANLL